jgi:hypothetical protein
VSDVTKLEALRSKNQYGPAIVSWLLTFSPWWAAKFAHWERCDVSKRRVVKFLCPAPLQRLKLDLQLKVVHGSLRARALVPVYWPLAEVIVSSVLWASVGSDFITTRVISLTILIQIYSTFYHIAIFDVAFPISFNVNSQQIQTHCCQPNITLRRVTIRFLCILYTHRMAKCFNCKLS